MLNRQIDTHGLLVIAATDGLFDPLRLAQYGKRGRFSQDPSDNSIRFAIPAAARGTAGATADALMSAAKEAGLQDNASVAAARAQRPSDPRLHRKT